MRGQVLILHPSAIDLNRNWHLPGGIRDDNNEPIEKTAEREVLEETGIDLAKSLPTVFKVGEWTAVDHGEPVKILAIFYTYVLPSRPAIKLSDEHDDFAWIDAANYKQYEANKEVYEVVEELGA